MVKCTLQDVSDAYLAWLTALCSAIEGKPTPRNAVQVLRERYVELERQYDLQEAPP